MGNFTYVPAEVPNACSTNDKIRGHIDGVQQELGWWKETSLFKYPYILISAHYGIEHPNFRRDIDFPTNGIIIGDSGGFQNMSLKEWKGQDININPVEVFEWQKNNCDIGFPLDYPPASNSQEHWKKSLEISKKNFEIAEGMYEQHLQDSHINNQKPMKLYNVLQNYGYDKKRINEWYKMASQFPNMSETGWGFGCKPESTPMLIAYLAMFLYDKGHKNNFHFLAVSGGRTIPIMAYLARYIDNITSDSSGWAQGSMMRKYFIPGYFGKFELFFGSLNKLEIKTLPCMCPVCEKIGNNVGMLSADGSAPGGTISLHNLHQIIQFSKLCNSLKDDTEVYKRFIKKMFDKEVLAAIEFIDYCVEKGFDKACDKFKQHFIMKTERKTTTGLMDY